jgi:hypothetical protein
MSNEKNNPIIHVAKLNNRDTLYLLLKKIDESRYTWFFKGKGKDEELSPVSGISVEEAIRKARSYWKNDPTFRMLNCGFRYTLPERDEHGSNALFHQMAASYSSSNGIYFDEDLGHNCIVHNASQEALDYFRRN